MWKIHRECRSCSEMMGFQYLFGTLDQRPRVSSGGSHSAPVSPVTPPSSSAVPCTAPDTPKWPFSWGSPWDLMDLGLSNFQSNPCRNPCRNLNIDIMKLESWKIWEKFHLYGGLLKGGYPRCHHPSHYTIFVLKAMVFGIPHFKKPPFTSFYTHLKLILPSIPCLIARPTPASLMDGKLRLEVTTQFQTTCDDWNGISLRSGDMIYIYIWYIYI